MSSDRLTNLYCSGLCVEGRWVVEGEGSGTGEGGDTGEGEECEGLGGTGGVEMSEGGMYM